MVGGGRGSGGEHRSLEQAGRLQHRRRERRYTDPRVPPSLPLGFEDEREFRMSTSSNLPRYQGRRTRSYVAPKDAAEIVNFAIDLKRPILVEGEPGCGKTRLAYSIAEELGLGDPVHITVKSTSRAQDLLYRVNT